MVLLGTANYRELIVHGEISIPAPPCFVDAVI